MILEVKDLKKHFPIRGKKDMRVKAVDGVNFSIEQGETFGLVGESGCGKTTVARLIIRLYQETSGEIICNGTDITKLKKSEMKKFRRDIQMVFQDPYASLNPRMTVERTLIDPLNIHGIGTPEERKKRVLELLEVVGLDKRYAKRYPHEFSGGQRQRIGIARALALNPKFIILDEAVSALDVSIQSQIINLLQELQERYKLTYLFISHDLSVIEYMCSTIGVMYLGKIVEIGTKDDIFRNQKHPYTQALLSAIPTLDIENKKKAIILKGDLPSPSNPPSGCAFHTRCGKAMEICKSEVPPTVLIDGVHSVVCHLYS
ncbi:MAG: ABC transporter ATP-binding protein [Clostridia bacterium]